MADERALRARIAPSEHQSQAMLFQWAALSVVQIPDLALLFAIPNFAGHHGSGDARLRSGAKAKREGRRAGVPDICLPVSRGPYHALFIEMKKPDKHPTATQNTWHEGLRAAGNRVAVCHSMDDARDVLLAYLALPKLFAVPHVTRHGAEFVIRDETSDDTWTFRKEEAHPNSTRIEMRMGGIVGSMSRRNPELLDTLRAAVWDGG